MSTGKKTTKRLVFIGGLSFVLLAGLVMVPVIILLSIAGGGAPAGCVPGGGTLSVTYNGPGVAGLSQLQMSRAAAIIGEGRQMGIPDRGIIVALATASQESHFQVYANDGKGGDLKSDQAGIASSLNIPHDAVGTDHGSLGVFQQQWPWWGTMQELMDPAKSAQKFYNALLQVPNWQNLPVTVAAQNVQSSAYPSAYADDQPIAEQLLATIGNNTGTSSGAGGNRYTLENGVYVGGTPTCATPVGTMAGGGTVVFPVPQNSGYVDQHNYGGKGAHWANYHTGDDLSVACGTPVLAATNGTVIIKTGSGWSWAGNWLVQIQTAGAGSLTTWYAHMRKLDVTNGEQVTAGQQIGEVGDLGNATGCHLHFEVHPKGGGYMEDDIDPDPWLAANVGKTLPGSTGGQGSFGIGTLNWRGASHYTKNPHPGERPYGKRVPNMVTKIGASGASIIGFQEFEPPQARAFLRATDGAWEIVAGKRRGHSSTADAIAYQPGAWKVDEVRYVSIRYGGPMIQVPLVRFTSTSGLGSIWVLNTHNPANAVGGTDAMRDAAVRTEAEALGKLQAAEPSTPLFLAGDMNDKARFKRLFLSLAGPGWSTANPTNKQIDWIMGGPGVSFSGAVVDQSTNDRAHRYTDHPFVHATAYVSGTQPVNGLTVLSYNINHHRADEALAQELANSGAQVIALQDTDAATVQWLAQRLGMQAAYAPLGKWQGKTLVDNALLSRYSMYDTDNTTLPVAEGDQTRGMLHAALGISRGVFVDVYATHLGGDQTVTLEQAQRAADEIDDSNCGAVLMGDMNTTPATAAHAALTEDLFDTFADGKYEPSKTTPSKDPTQRVDYLLHDKSTKVATAQVMPAGGSTHRAVRATFSIGDCE